MAADRRYWERWGTAAKAGAWLKELRTLAAQITSELGTEIMFFDLGDLQVELVDGAAQPLSDPTVRLEFL